MPKLATCTWKCVAWVTLMLIALMHVTGCATGQLSPRLRDTAPSHALARSQAFADQEKFTAAPTAEVVALGDDSFSPSTPTPSGPVIKLASTQAVEPVPTASNQVAMNLPTTLAMVGGGHPVVGFAQARVQEAYAQLERAQAMWLPSIQTGFNSHRHDGAYQAVDGSIVDVNSNSYQYGLGAGAIAAGTTPRPGIVAQFHMADAIFLPKATERTAWARGHAANAALNQQLLVASSAYVELLDAHQECRIIEQSRERMAGLAKITDDFAEVGEGLQADADRVRTELALLDSRRLGAMERRAVASARLARAVSLDAQGDIVPQDAVVVPLDLVTVSAEKSELIATGLTTRPELKEAQALVSAACEAYRREKYAPFVPSVLLGFSTGSFGGGLGNSVSNSGGRYDLDALMMWEVRNLGLGEQAARRERSAQVQQARFNTLRMLDQVAQEVSEAASQVEFRRQQISLTETAIKSATDSYEHNLDRIRESQGLPIEALQAVQALENAQRAYLRAVTDYNQAQLRLQWSLGWPISIANSTSP